MSLFLSLLHTFINLRFEKIKEVNIPCPTYTASLHQDKEIFVCGGEDLKLYKFDYQTGIEIENFKGHFGPVHCVRFSPGLRLDIFATS